MSRELSKIGIEIEGAIARNFVRHSESVKYMSYFRTPGGSVFGVEQGTSNHINLWLPEQEDVRRAAEDATLPVDRKVAWPNGRDSRYGRISSLKSIPELRDAPLLKVQVTTVGESMRVVHALL